MTFHIRVAQLNFCVGDIAGNAQKIANAARQAHADGIQLLLTPELSICGYAAEDLFFHRVPNNNGQPLQFRQILGQLVNRSNARLNE